MAGRRKTRLLWQRVADRGSRNRFAVSFTVLLCVLLLASLGTQQAPVYPLILPTCIIRHVIREASPQICPLMLLSGHFLLFLVSLEWGHTAALVPDPRSMVRAQPRQPQRYPFIQCVHVCDGHCTWLWLWTGSRDRLQDLCCRDHLPPNTGFFCGVELTASYFLTSNIIHAYYMRTLTIRGAIE